MTPGIVTDIPDADTDITPVVLCLTEFDKEASIAEVYVIVGKLISEHERFYHLCEICYQVPKLIHKVAVWLKIPRWRWMLGGVSLYCILRVLIYCLSMS